MQDTFALLALSIVAEIPAGMVASYGQIALLAGFPKRARMVGAVMSRASQYGDYPCHRVVHSDGSPLYSAGNSRGNCWKQKASSLPSRERLICTDADGSFERKGRTDGIQNWKKESVN